MVADPVGRTSQPLPKPSMSEEGPRSLPVPSTVAFHPLLMLSPRTSQYGWVAPVMSRWTCVAVCETTRTAGAGPGRGAASAAPLAAARGEPAPPGAESRASWSMSMPVVAPGALSTTWLPAARVIPAASGPHGVTVSPPPCKAPVVEPDSATDTGWPSMVRRSDRQPPGNVGAGAPTRVPGMPSSAMPRGREIGGVVPWNE